MPSIVLVSGAGSSEVNGLYIEAGVSDGKNFYNLQSGGYVIAWDNPNWVIRNITSITLYTSNNNVEFPWQVTSWSTASGSAPAPSVTDVPTFGLPADVVALIISRFGSVARYLRLRNLGQI